MVSNIQQPNRFACNCAKPGTKSSGSGWDDKEYVKDITWNPNTNTIVVEKNNKRDLTIDLSELIGESNATDEDIKLLVWNPSSEQYVSSTIVKKGTSYTVAMQKIVAAIGSDSGTPFHNNVQKLIDDQRLKDQESGFFLRWGEWEDDD